MGRKQFERVTVIGSFPGKRVRFIKNDFPEGVMPSNQGDNLVFDVYAPEGMVAETQALKMYWGSILNGVAGGYRQIQCVAGSGVDELGNDYDGIGMLLGVQKAETPDDLHYRYGAFEGADYTDGMKPSDVASQTIQQTKIVFDYDTPVRFKFFNNT